MNLNEYKVLKELNEAKKPIFFRKLSEISGVSIGGTQQVLRDYSDFLDKNIEGRNTYYSFKKSVGAFYLRKMVEIKTAQMFILRNPLFSDFFAYFVKNDMPCVIFGSYAKGNASKKSDIDVLVLSSKKIPEHLCPVEIHLISMTKSKFEKAVKGEEILIKEISNNHIIVHGFDYFMRWLNEEN